MASSPAVSLSNQFTKESQLHDVIHIGTRCGMQFACAAVMGLEANYLLQSWYSHDSSKVFGGSPPE